MKFLIFLIFVGCSATPPKQLTQDIVSEMQKVCLSGEGKGQLDVGGSKYSFSYESMWEREENRWSLGLDFPLQDQQILTLDLNNKKSQLEGGLAEKILKENDDVDPKRLNVFLVKWSEFINSILAIQDTKDLNKSTVHWEIKKHLLISEVKLPEQNFMRIEFFEPEEKFFRRMKVTMGPKGNQADEINLELYVRKCLFLPE